MDHPQAETLLPAYFAGRLDRETMRAFHAHLKGCEICRSRMRLQKAVAQSEGDRPDKSLTSPDTQAQIARNRDLLIKILLLMIFAWFVWKFKR